MEDLWLDHSDVPVLPSRLRNWCICERLDRSSQMPCPRSASPRYCWVPHVWMLQISCDIRECGWLRGSLWVCYTSSTNVLFLRFLTSDSIFLALGELGPGNNLGLCAAKSSATAIRGQYYSYCAAIGKIGAFVGTYVLPIVRNNAPNPVRAGQDPFFVSSSLCIFSAFLAYFLLPQIDQVCLDSD